MATVVEDILDTVEAMEEAVANTMAEIEAQHLY